MKVITIRPQPGCSATIKAGAELDLAIEGYPLFEIQKLDWDAPNPSAFDALLVGSANAIRHGGAALERYHELPVHAVGQTTAEAAGAAGFRVARTGEGGLQDLLDNIEEPISYLRLAGEDHVPLAPPASVSIIMREVYRSAALPFPCALMRELVSGAIVLLHSGVAARHFATECERLDLDRSTIALAALAPRIAEAAGKGWGGLQTAPQPTDCALLALARDMCH